MSQYFRYSAFQSIEVQGICFVVKAEETNPYFTRLRNTITDYVFSIFDDEWRLIMNSLHQRHSAYLQHLTNKQTQNLGLVLIQSDVKNHLKKYFGQTIGAISLVGLCMVIGTIFEPMISGDRVFALAETCVKPSSLQNFLTTVTFGDDRVTRYAAAANAIESKRLEIFRTAKSNPNWSDVANLAELRQTKVCDLTSPPEFLQSLCDQLRSYSEEEICRNGFTTKEFNQITLEQKQNPQLRSLIQDRQMQLQGKK